MSMHPLFESMRKNPGMYLGTNDHSLTALYAFLTGYQCGYCDGNLKPRSPSVLADAWLLPPHFPRFVAEYYGCKSPDDQSWLRLMREHADSEKAAVRLFFELLEEYDRQQPQRP